VSDGLQILKVEANPVAARQSTSGALDQRETRADYRRHGRRHGGARHRNSPAGFQPQRSAALDRAHVDLGMLVEIVIERRRARLRGADDEKVRSLDIWGSQKC